MESAAAIEQLQKYIEKNVAKEHRVVRALDALDGMSIGMDVLQATGIGKYINELRRRHPELGETVIDKAKALVHKWKLLVQTVAAAAKEDSKKKAPTLSSTKVANSVEPAAVATGDRKPNTARGQDCGKAASAAASAAAPRGSNEWPGKNDTGGSSGVRAAASKVVSGVVSVTVQESRPKASDAVTPGARGRCSEVAVCDLPSVSSAPLPVHVSSSSADRKRQASSESEHEGHHSSKRQRTDGRMASGSGSTGASRAELAVAKAARPAVDDHGERGGGRAAGSSAAASAVPGAAKLKSVRDCDDSSNRDGISSVSSCPGRKRSRAHSSTPDDGNATEQQRRRVDGQVGSAHGDKHRRHDEVGSRLSNGDGGTSDDGHRSDSGRRKEGSKSGAGATTRAPTASGTKVSHLSSRAAAAAGVAPAAAASYRPPLVDGDSRLPTPAPKASDSRRRGSSSSNYSCGSGGSHRSAQVDGDSDEEQGRPAGQHETSAPADVDGNGSADEEEPQTTLSFEEMLAYDAAIVARGRARKRKLETASGHGAKSTLQKPDSKRARDSADGRSSHAAAAEQSPSKRSKGESSSRGGGSSSRHDAGKATTTSGLSAAVSASSTPSKASTSKWMPDPLPSAIAQTSAMLAPPPPSGKLAISAADIISGLPEISADYRPAPASSRKPLQWPESREDALSAEPFELGAKHHSHTQVYSGRKQRSAEMLPLFDLCLRVLMNNIGSIGYVGQVPCSILMPVLKKCTVPQLLELEYYNPVFVSETDELWKKHCQRDFAGNEPGEYESWRELYLSLRDQQEKRVEEIAARVSALNKLKAPERKTKLAYMDSMAKPPREVRRMQQKLGTASSASAKAPSATASASGCAPARPREVPRYAPSSSSSAPAPPASRPRAAPAKTVAPLMKQTLKFAKGAWR